MKCTWKEQELKDQFPRGVYPQVESDRINSGSFQITLQGLREDEVRTIANILANQGDTK